jgi:hypothetical protein
MSTASPKPSLRLVLLFYLLFAFLYSVLVPMWEAPDETAHYLYVLILAREERLPTDAETYEALQPPGYYWPAAQLFRLLDTIDPELIRPYRPPISEVGLPTRYSWTADNYRPLWGARILRWLNIIPGALTLLFIYKGARRLFPDSVIPVATAALAGLTPQFLHISASITNDSLGNLTGAFFFWLITVVVQERQKWWQTAWWQTAPIILAALLLPFIAKLTILPMSFTLLLALFWQRRDSLGRYWHWLAGGGVLLALLLAGILSLVVLNTETLIWRTIWLRAIYIRPDFFSLHELWFMMEAFAHGYWGRLSFRQVGLSPTLALWLTGLAELGLVASLGMLLKAKSGLRQRLYWFGLPILALIALGLLWTAGKTSQWWAIPTPALIMTFIFLFLALVRYRQINRAAVLSIQRPLWALLWTAAVITLLVIIKNTLSTPQYQGRFFFPALGPISVLITAGWYALLPRRLAPYLPHLILVLLIILNLYVWLDQVIPLYYQPFLD